MQQDKNKGIAIRNKKIARNNSNMRKTKDNQKGICRFIEIECPEFMIVNHKRKCVGRRKKLALQIENKAYLPDRHYKFINNKNLKIKKIYKDIPFNADYWLVELYQSKADAAG